MTNVDRDRLRRGIIRVLAAHRDADFRLPVLIDRLMENMPDLSFSETDVLESLAFLEGLWYVKKLDSELLGPPRWKIHQGGINFHDRNG